jgi:hypothetical protein
LADLSGVPVEKHLQVACWVELQEDLAVKGAEILVVDHLLVAHVAAADEGQVEVDVAEYFAVDHLLRACGIAAGSPEEEDEEVVAEGRLEEEEEEAADTPAVAVDHLLVADSQVEGEAEAEVEAAAEMPPVALESTHSDSVASSSTGTAGPAMCSELMRSTDQCTPVSVVEAALCWGRNDDPPKT